MNGNIEEFILNNRKKAEEYAIDSAEAQKDYGIPPFKTKEELISWLKNNSVNIDPEKYWAGHEISKAFSTVESPPPQEPQQYEQAPLGNAANLLGLFAIPFVFGQQPELMEDDPKYHKLREELKEKWLKENPTKDFESKEGIDYLHGSLDDSDAPTLDNETEKAFREKYPKKAERFDKKAQQVYKNSEDDPAVQKTRQKINEHIEARKKLLERTGSNESWENIRKKIEHREWDEFAKRYEKKAYAYRQKIKEVDRALDRREIRQKLAQYANASGKDVRYVEKAGRTAPKISIDETTRRLESIHTTPSRTGVSEATRRLEAIHPPQTLSPYASAHKPQASFLSPKRRRGLMDFGNFLHNKTQIFSTNITSIKPPFALMGPQAKIGIVIALSIVILVIFFFGDGGGTPLGGGGSGSGSPGGGGGSEGGGGRVGDGLDYFIPFRDPSILPINIKNTIASNWPKAKLENFDNIVAQSKDHNWNPSFILTLWIEESGGQGVPADDPLGCAPDPKNPNDNIDVALGCLFGTFDSLTPDRFADFMCRYDQGANAPCTFNNKNFPITIKSVYSTLVKDGPGALVLITPTPQGLISASCPLSGGASKVSCGSKFNSRGSPLCGHCNPETSYKDNMDQCDYEAINYAEDIAGAPGESVYLPSIDGNTIIWTYQREATSMIGVTRYYGGLDEKNGKKYWLQLHHVDSGSGVREGISGDIGAKICTTDKNCSHVHVEFSTVDVGSGKIPIDASTTFCI